MLSVQRVCGFEDVAVYIYNLGQTLGSPPFGSCYVYFERCL